MRSVFLVTHGEKFEGADPGMTMEGMRQVKLLSHLIPDCPSQIVVGTGRRHRDVAQALFGFLNSDSIRHTATVGGPESLDSDGKVVLADGTRIPRGQFTTTEDGSMSMFALVTSLPDGAVICSGRPAMIMLGVKDAKSAAVYRILVSELGHFIRAEEVTA